MLFFAEHLVFSNIFGFLAVNRALKWIETVIFSCIPFKPKFKIFKDFSNTVFFLLETTYGRNFSKIKQNLGSKGPKNPPKWAISWILNPYKKLLILQISQPHKLYWWNLPQLYIWIRSFIWQNYGVYLPGCTRA